MTTPQSQHYAICGILSTLSTYDSAAGDEGVLELLTELTPHWLTMEGSDFSYKLSGHITRLFELAIFKIVEDCADDDSGVAILDYLLRVPKSKELNNVFFNMIKESEHLLDSLRKVDDYLLDDRYQIEGNTPNRQLPSPPIFENGSTLSIEDKLVNLAAFMVENDLISFHDGDLGKDDNNLAVNLIARLPSSVESCENLVRIIQQKLPEDYFQVFMFNTLRNMLRVATKKESMAHHIDGSTEFKMDFIESTLDKVVMLKDYLHTMEDDKEFVFLFTYHMDSRNTKTVLIQNQNAIETAAAVIGDYYRKNIGYKYSGGVYVDKSPSLIDYKSLAIDIVIKFKELGLQPNDALSKDGISIMDIMLSGLDDDYSREIERQIFLNDHGQDALNHQAEDDPSQHIKPFSI